MTERKILTTASGIPVSDNQNTQTAGTRGPSLLQDVHMIEKLAHFNRERIPERVLHAKGAGARGYFEVTNDITKWTKAKFLSELGQQTPVTVRFSTVAGEKGSADTERDPRGFAIRFYTEDGNYDLVGNNTPVFFIRDAIKFPDLIHSQKRHPATNCKNPDAVWDFFSLTPESTHQVTVLFSDRGIPKTYRHMHGFGSHTFKWTNKEGESVWVKYHLLTEQGIENLTAEEATRLAGVDPDFVTRDLYNAIEKGDYPAWRVYVQIMPLEDADTYRFDPFDVTKVWSHKDYPLIEVGKMVLDKNPKNYFMEMEQVAFSPGNVVPGIGLSPDKMLQGRVFAYSDAQRYRLGANYQSLPINRARNEVNNYQRDGAMRFDDNGADSVYYEPNSFGGPIESPEDRPAPLKVKGLAKSSTYENNDYYTQAGDLYRLMSEKEKETLTQNIISAMKPVRKDIQERQLKHFVKADPDYGLRVAKGLGLTIEV